MTGESWDRPGHESGVGIFPMVFAGLGVGLGGLLGTALARSSGQLPEPVGAGIGAAVGLLIALGWVYATGWIIEKPAADPLDVAMRTAGFNGPYMFADTAFGVISMGGQTDRAFDGYIALDYLDATLVPADGSGVIALPPAGIAVYRPGNRFVKEVPNIVGSVLLNSTFHDSHPRYDVIDFTFPGGRATVRLAKTVPADVLRQWGIVVVTDDDLCGPVVERAIAPFRSDGRSSS